MSAVAALIYSCLFCFGYNRWLGAHTNQENQQLQKFIVEYLQRKYVSSVSVFTCPTENGSHAAFIPFKELSRRHFYFNVIADSHVTTELHQQHYKVGVLIDLQCSGGERILKNLDNSHRFFVNHIWLLVTRNMEILENFLSAIFITPDSDCKAIILETGLLLDVYKVARCSALKLSLVTRRFAAPENATRDLKAFERYQKYRKLDWIYLKSGIVVAFPDVHTSIDDLNMRHIDTIAKVNYPLTANLGQDLQFRTRYIRPVTQLLITLRFYALGSMQVSIADFAGVSISSVCVILRKVTIALAQQRPHFIKMPRTSEEQLAASAKFYDFARFPRVIGAIDCTHIKIQSPGGNEAENFRNRKGWFSINTQVVCTEDMKITNIVARWPGASHDQTIFNASNIKNQLEQREFGNYIIIGDSGYRNSQYLATSHLHPASATEQLYNESHIRTRNVIERTFGVWKRRFPVLSLGMRLRIETVQAIIVACAVLHNIAINEKVPEAPTGIDDFEELLAGTEMPTVRCDQQNIAGNVRECVLMPYFRQMMSRETLNANFRSAENE